MTTGSYLNDDGNTDPIVSFDILNFPLAFDRGKITYAAEDGKTKISPTKAANAFIEHYELLAVNECDKNEKIWIYDNKKGVYTPNGTRFIKYMLEELGGDLCTPQIETRVINFIFNHRPFSMEKFDPQPHLICVRNGVIDLRNGDFMKHSHKYLMTLHIDIEYDSTAKCLVLDKFLDDVVEDLADKETIYDFLAATLIKKAFDAFLSLTGVGRNGKGRLILFIRWFFGEENVTTTRIDTLGARFANKWIYRKLLILNGEFEGNFPIKDVKDITSGNPRQAEIKNGGVFDFLPYAKVMLDTNNPPVIKDTSIGRTRRHYNLNFIKSFVDNPIAPNEMKIDRDILSKLETEEQKSGLLNELISRAAKLLAGGTIYRRKTEQQTADEYEIQTHSVSAFVDNQCELDINDYGFAYSSDLYEAYKHFCTTINVPPKSQKAIGMYLTKIGFRSTQEGERRLTAYRGVKLKAEVGKAKATATATA